MAKPWPLFAHPSACGLEQNSELKHLGVQWHTHNCEGYCLDKLHLFPRQDDDLSCPSSACAAKKVQATE